MHPDGNITKGDPYSHLLKDGICPIGCGFNGQKSEIRTHLVLLHSKEQLKKWNFNRDF
jgi:hypothetical protein